MGTTSVWSRLPIHPLAIAVAPILGMYAATPGSAERTDLIPASLTVLIVAAALLLIATVVYRDLRKAALFVSVLLIVFLAVGEFYASIEEWQVAGVRPARRRYVVPVMYLALAGWGVWLFRARRSFASFTALANIVAVGGLLPPAVTFVRANMTSVPSHSAQASRAPVIPAAAVTARPDIYYVIFDRYGDERTLRAHGVDNTPLFRYLEEKGFFVARESRSNYINTVLSLASSLNMTYLDDLAAVYGERSDDWRGFYEWIRMHRVGAFLRSQGYQYIHLGSWHAATRDNPQATRNVNYYITVPKAAMRLLDNILFEPVRYAMPTPLLDERRQHWHRSVREVEDVVELASDPGPKFVVLHLLVPHHPYAFDRDGGFVSREEENRRTRSENYASQVLAANLMIRRLVDGVLERSPSPPVIILQGDEGPYPLGTEDASFQWLRAGAEILRERSGILNAYYLPGDGAKRLHPHISPVNSFRVVFNEYLGTRLPILPDRTIGHLSDRQPYAFADVTDVVTRPQQQSIATTGAVP